MTTDNARKRTTLADDRYARSGQYTMFFVLCSAGILTCFGYWYSQQPEVPTVTTTAEVAPEVVTTVPVRPRYETQPQPEPPFIEAPAHFTPLDLQSRRASWTNLSQSNIWFAPGWDIGENSLTSPRSGAAAVFRQPYQRVSFTFRAKPLLETSDTEPAPAQPVDLDVRFTIPGTKTGLVLRLANSRASLISELEQQPRELRSVELPVPESSLFVRVVTTGERLLISLDEQLLMNVEWPRPLVGKSFVVSLQTPGEPLTFSEMRLDGE